MPTWLLNLLINMALKYGLPWVVSKFPWLFSKFPNLVQIIMDLIKAIEDGLHPQKAREDAALRIKKECFGVGCPVDLKR